MDDVLALGSVSDYCKFLGVACRNELVEAIDFTKLDSVARRRKMFGFYTLVFVENADGSLASGRACSRSAESMQASLCSRSPATLTYGLNDYDLTTGDMILIGAGQTIGNNSDTIQHPQGFAIAWHADLMASTPFAGQMKDFRYFSYDTHEALPVTLDERETLWDYFYLIDRTLANQPIDQHTSIIIASIIISLLTLTQRIYDRHYVEHTTAERTLLSRFEDIIMNYFTSGQSRQHGLPTVQYCADKLCLSPNYFGDLIKKATGQSAKEYILQVTMVRCKILLSGTDKPVSEIAEELGYGYTHHLARVFKKMTGMTPQEYRKQRSCG